MRQYLTTLADGAAERLALYRHRLIQFLWSQPRSPDPAFLRRALSWMLLARVLIFTTLYLLAYLYTWRNVSNHAAYAATFWPALATFGISGVNLIWLRNTSNPTYFGYGQFVTDVLLSTLAIYFTGSVVPIALYLLVILGAGFVYGGHAAVLIAVAAAASYSLIALAILPPLHGHQIADKPQDVLVLYLSLILAALVSGYFAQQLAVMGSLAETTTKHLNDLTEHQRQLFDDLSEGIITLDLSAAITGMNQAASAIIGLTDLDPARVIGQRVDTVMRQAGVHNFDALIELNSQGELSLPTTGMAEPLQLRYSTRELSDSNGATIGGVIVLNDISHIKGIEDQLRHHEQMTQLLAETSSTTRDSSHHLQNLPPIVGESQVMHKILSLVSRVAASDASVLLVGEGGTGKELIAKAIHCGSAQHAGPFVVFDCHGIPEQELEVELFGRGVQITNPTDNIAGVFSRARGGTLYLNEIGTLSIPLQTKILRSLLGRRHHATDSRDPTPRILAGTRHDLKQEVIAGRFREDLYYRLNVVTVPLPPLRERREDIPFLVRHFIGQQCGDYQPLPRISPEALQLLMSYSFPGNVSELENIVERAVVLGGTAILPEHLPRELTQGPTRPAPVLGGEVVETSIIELPIDLEAELARIEQRYIDRAMELSGGVKKQAANLLGLNFRSFRYRLKKYAPERETPDA